MYTCLRQKKKLSTRPCNLTFRRILLKCLIGVNCIASAAFLNDVAQAQSVSLLTGQLDTALMLRSELALN